MTQTALIVPSTDAIPQASAPAGSLYAVSRYVTSDGVQVFDIYEVGAGGPGLSGFTSLLKKIGAAALPLAGIVAAPFTKGATLALINAGGTLGGGLLSHANASAQATKDIGAQFDQLAGQVTQLFNAIQAKPVITADDFAQANSAYQELAAMAQQYGSVAYVARQWSSAAYQPAYEQRLSQIAQAASGSSAPAGITAGASVDAASGLPSWAIPAALVVLFFALRK